MKRRQFLQYAGAGTSALMLPQILSFAKANDFPVRAITSGPKYHWFGYYDKLQFNHSNTKGLGREVDFEMRSPTKDDVIKIKNTRGQKTGLSFSEIEEIWAEEVVKAG